MVCPRCISTVSNIFKELNIPVKNVKLGEVLSCSLLSQEQLEKVESELSKVGFEILAPGKSVLISQIKSMIIHQIHFGNEPLKVNYSTFLSDELNHDYSSLSKLYSSVEGKTIERFITQQKIEKVKEYLVYNELNLSQIAHEMGYSSVAHLSTQFKKETGMTPTKFKNQERPVRTQLDQL